MTIISMTSQTRNAKFDDIQFKINNERKRIDLTILWKINKSSKILSKNIYKRERSNNLFREMSKKSYHSK